MEHAAGDFFLTWRRLFGAVLIVSLLVSFWAERPSSAASVAEVPLEVRKAINPNASPTAAEPAKTSIIHALRRPWLGFYTAMGAPDLRGGKLTAAEEQQFRGAVGRVAFCFFALALALWLWGRRVARHAIRP